MSIFSLQAESSYLKLGMNRRDEFLEILRNSSETVLQLLVGTLYRRIQGITLFVVTLFEAAMPEHSHL